MKYMKRINKMGNIPAHYVVYKDMSIVGMYLTKQEAEKAMEEA